MHYIWNLINIDGLKKRKQTFKHNFIKHENKYNNLFGENHQNQYSHKNYPFSYCGEPKTASLDSGKITESTRYDPVYTRVVNVCNILLMSNQCINNELKSNPHIHPEQYYDIRTNVMDIFYDIQDILMNY